MQILHHLVALVTGFCRLIHESSSRDPRKDVELVARYDFLVELVDGVLQTFARDILLGQEGDILPAEP